MKQWKFFLHWSSNVPFQQQYHFFRKKKCKNRKIAFQSQKIFDSSHFPLPENGKFARVNISHEQKRKHERFDTQFQRWQGSLLIPRMLAIRARHVHANRNIFLVPTSRLVRPSSSPFQIYRVNKCVRSRIFVEIRHLSFVCFFSSLRHEQCQFRQFQRQKFEAGSANLAVAKKKGLRPFGQF